MRRIGLFFLLVGVILEILSFSFYFFYLSTPSCPAGDTTCGAGGAYFVVLVDYPFYLGWVFIALGGVLLIYDSITNRRRTTKDNQSMTGQNLTVGH